MQQTEGLRHFLLSTFLCLLPLQMPGLPKGDATSSTGKSCITEESGPGKPMMCTLCCQRKSAQDAADCHLGQMNIAISRARRPRQKVVPPTLQVHMAPASLRPARQSARGTPPYLSHLGVRTPRLAVLRAMVHLEALPAA